MDESASRLSKAFLRPLRISRFQVWVIRGVFAGLIVGVPLLGFWGAHIAISGHPKPPQCKAVCKELELGVANFITEYESLPAEIESDVTYDLNSPEGLKLLEVLMGSERGTSPLNQKGLRLVDIKEGKGKRGGLIYNATGDAVVGLYDPWGGSYKIQLDGNGDEIIDVRPKAQDQERRLEGRRVAVWSDGAQ